MKIRLKRCLAPATLAILVAGFTGAGGRTGRPAAGHPAAPAGARGAKSGRRRAGDDAFSAAQGSIRLRYRPILMTAFGTIAMQRAVGLERLSPLADAAIGGLLVGTVLSLFYLPMFYVWVSGKAQR